MPRIWQRFAPSPRLTVHPLPRSEHTCAVSFADVDDAVSGQIVGERGGTAFPFRFWRGNAVLLAYTTAVVGRGKRPSVVR